MAQEQHGNTIKSVNGVHLSWNGAHAVSNLLRKTNPRVLAEITGLSYGPEEERKRNRIIEGDPLQAIASLYGLMGTVDFIYADPPYNTGNGDFRYNDRWETDPNDANPGDYVGLEDAGRHTKWLNFMAPRLHMFKRVLKPSGVIAISIDDREIFRLGMLMDDIFGEKNRLGIINWQKKYTPSNDSKHVSPSTEYVLVYAKREAEAKTTLLARTKEMDARYDNPDNDRKGDWKSNSPSAKTYSTANDYAIQNPFTGELVYPPEGRVWSYQKSTMKAWLEDWGSSYKEKKDPSGKAPMLVIDGDFSETKKRAQERYKQGNWPVLYFFDKGHGRPAIKRYLKDVKQGRVVMTYLAEEDYEDQLNLGCQSWDHEQSGHNQDASKLLNAVMGADHNFTTPKPLKLIKTLIQLWCPPNGLVLDPFGGSGTTGHAILDLNHETGADRSFIMIEPGNPNPNNPKEGDLYARTLTAERVKRAITGKWASGKREPLGGGFRFETAGKMVDDKAILHMERLEIMSLIAQSDGGTKRSIGFTRLLPDWSRYTYLIGVTKLGQGVCLCWAEHDGVVDPSVIKKATQEAKLAGLKMPPKIYGRSKTCSGEGFEFCRIPDTILDQLGIKR